MKKLAVVVVLCLCLSACQTEGGSVADKVLADFGLRDRPEGYVSGTDRVYANLGAVGDTEMKRLNLGERHGELKFQQDGLRGTYYKEVKVYENFYPLDATPASRSGQDNAQEYYGYVEYAFRVYQSERFATRAEAEAAMATIRTDVEGREVYRYNFTSGGNWDGGKGSRTKR